MSEDAVITKRPSRWRYAWWLSLLLLGILIGWLLAPRCPRCSAQGGSGDAPHSAAQGSSAAPGKPSGGAASGTPDSVNLGGLPIPLDLGSATGRNRPGIDGPGVGQVTGSSKGESAGGSGGGSDEKEPPADPTAAAITQGNGADVKEAVTARNQVQSADDFRYDKTGLPRYSQSVTTVASTLTRDRLVSGKYHSTCAIVTSGKFQDVVDWYKTNLPQGWQAQTVGDLNALAQQVSMSNIMSTLTAAAQTAATPTAAAPRSKSSPAAHPDNAVSVAMFSPPPGTSGEPSIMIQQKIGTAVEITMSKNGSGRLSPACG